MIKRTNEQCYSNRRKHELPPNIKIKLVSKSNLDEADGGWTSGFDARKTHEIVVVVCVVDFGVSGRNAGTAQTLLDGGRCRVGKKAIRILRIVGIFFDLMRMRRTVFSPIYKFQQNISKSIFACLTNLTHLTLGLARSSLIVILQILWFGHSDVGGFGDEAEEDDHSTAEKTARGEKEGVVVTVILDGVHHLRTDDVAHRSARRPAEKSEH